MLLHFNDNKLISYRSKEGFFVGKCIEKRARSFVGNKKERIIIEVLERQ